LSIGIDATVMLHQLSHIIIKLSTVSLAGQDDDETASIQSVPLPKDVFRIRQMQKARGGTTSQTGSTSYGSAFSGEHSGSTS